MENGQIVLEPSKAEADLRGVPLRVHFFKKVGGNQERHRGKGEVVNSEHRAAASRKLLSLTIPQQ